MALDEEDEQFLPGVAEILASIRDTPAPELAPPSSPRDAPTIPHSHPIHQAWQRIASIEPAYFVLTFTDDITVWSKFSRRVLSHLLEPLEGNLLGPASSRPDQLRPALRQLRMGLVRAVNALDSVATTAGVELDLTCPDSCSGTRTPVAPSAPLPPPLLPTLPAPSDTAAPPSVPSRAPSLAPLPPAVSYTPGPFVPVPFVSGNPRPHDPLPLLPLARVVLTKARRVPTPMWLDRPRPAELGH